MSDNVGLSTPRGSGTSGYVQRNLAHLRPRDRAAPYHSRDLDSLKHRQRQPDREILEHERKREVEVKVFELRDRLEDEGIDEDEIDKQCAALRTELQAKQAAGGKGRVRDPAVDGAPRRQLKAHQVHELADAKIKESERLRNALRISKDYEEGGHWKRQEERLRKAVEREREPPAPAPEDRGRDRDRD
ncbi:cwf21-domain-containing protein [Durotheca rogersii]|uniref:cwf21-domain-containing protein n=1 Tax=Durotheca rogersii TaxID=419775 RepID=UPI00221E48D4|nr:cwf21-domain-containing protein [Durotheca rogersii]KAI5863229.1 cwf21-domain-containing protein [Durotheca rogersii]